MRSVFRSSPPGAPRSIAKVLSMPRPAYMAAHSPAGPAPTMITSYPLVALSVIRPEFQSRGIPLPRQGARQLRAKVHGLELDVRPLRAGELLEGRPTDDIHAVTVAAFSMEQRGRRLNQPLPHGRRGFRNNRTPDGFQGLVSEPVLAGVELVAGAREDRSAFVGGQGRSRAVKGGQGRSRAVGARVSPPFTALDRLPPPDFQHVQRTVTARDRPHQHPGRLAARPRSLHGLIALEHGVHRERPDAEHMVPAYEQGRPANGLAPCL